jgi:dUTPase
MAVFLNNSNSNNSNSNSNSNSNNNDNNNDNNNNNDNTTYILNNLLNTYERVMVLKLYIDSNDENLRYKYMNAVNSHNNKIIQQSQHIDAGFDLFAPGNEGEELDIYGTNLRFFGPGWDDASSVNKIDFKVCCSARMFIDRGKNFNTGYYMYPRSSLSKTQLRLANSTGIIDAGYRGHIIGMFDVVNVEETEDNIIVQDNIEYNNSEADYWGKKFDRYVQICGPNLCPIVVELVESIEELGDETDRGSGGFGSTGH